MRLNELISASCWFLIGFVVAMEIYKPDSLAKAFLRGLIGP